ncbi:hypothetical protein EG329_007909 [Mollisiaceae sp. DMI_Dod_QoI]|nr:hypothetical protein EG329_007909 [Helotiales sp. DMI_Dod_QoI]
MPFSVDTGLTGHAFVPDTVAAAVTSTITVSTGSSTTSAQSSNTAAESQSASPSASAAASKAGVSTGAIAGASIGCAFGGLLLGTALSFLLLRRRNGQLEKVELPAGSNVTYLYDAPKDPYPGPPSGAPFSPEQNHYSPAAHQCGTPVQEISAEAPSHELDGAYHRGAL